MKSVDWKQVAGILEGHGFRIVYNPAELTNVKADNNDYDKDYSYILSDGNRTTRFALGGDVMNRAHNGFGGMGITVAINSDPDGIVASSSYWFYAMNTNMADTTIINNTGDLFEDEKVNNLGEIVTLINKKLYTQVAKDVKESEEQ
jgi:hypothetical protein